MAIPTTRAARTAYIATNPHLDQITMPELAQSLSIYFAQHAALCQAVARWLGLSKRERQWPQLVARSYAASFCGSEALAEVLLTGGFVAFPVAATLF